MDHQPNTNCGCDECDAAREAQEESDRLHRENNPHYFSDDDICGRDEDDDSDVTDDCPFCEGDGCEECDGTGDYV